MNKLTVSLLALFFCLSLAAQEVSPYSRYGIGDLSRQSFAASKALGGLSAAYQSPYNLNYRNPASYGALSFTSLEMGVRFRTTNLATIDSSYQTGDGFIDYLALGIPFTPNKTGRVQIGGSVGLIPLSQMNYNIQRNLTDTNGIALSNLFSGQGRTYDLYFGTGVQISGRDTMVLHIKENSRDTIFGLNKFSIGLNAAYRFGTLSYGEVLILEETSGTLNSRKNTSVRLNDMVLTGGMQYRFLLNRKKISGEYAYHDSLALGKQRKRLEYDKLVFMTIGAYVNSPLNLKAGINSTYDRFYRTSTGVLTIDTVFEVEGGKQALNLPMTVGVGAAFGNDQKWLLGFDLAYTNWSNFSPILNPATFNDTWRTTVAFEYTPDLDNQKSVIKRMSYRFGGYYDTGYLTLKGQQISEYGITFGFGMPLGKPDRQSWSSGISYLNISFEVGGRGTTQQDLIRETYFGGTVGILLNDRWFKPAKYD